MPSNSQSSRLSVAITGAGSGLGRDIALGFAAKGYRVFGTAMSLAEAESISESSNGLVELKVCDITDEGAVRDWAIGLEDALGESGLNILVNNAGVLTPGPIEAMGLDAIRREFDVNVFGAVSVINALLGALRKSSGRIVQVSTWTATLPLPFNGSSGASKAAMDVFATVYRAELKPFGIDVVVAKAGNMKTGGPEKTAAALKRAAGTMTPDQVELYGRTFEAFSDSLNKMQSEGLESASAALEIIELAERTPAPSIAPIGDDAAEMLRAARELSDADQDAVRLELAGIA